jgi:hypothetical protein
VHFHACSAEHVRRLDKVAQCSAQAWWPCSASWNCWSRARRATHSHAVPIIETAAVPFASTFHLQHVPNVKTSPGMRLSNLRIQHDALDFWSPQDMPLPRPLPPLHFPHTPTAKSEKSLRVNNSQKTTNSEQKWDFSAVSDD